MRRIKISAGQVSSTATLNESPAADGIWAALPISASASRWGHEIYFSISAKVRDPKKQAVVQKGDLGFWEPGNAFCIFWGPTPASTGDEIRPASPVSVFGRIDGDAEAFEGVRQGSRVTIEREVE